jgi:hypothetical protein
MIAHDNSRCLRRTAITVNEPEYRLATKPPVPAHGAGTDPTGAQDRQELSLQQAEIILVPEIDHAVNPAGVKGLGELANVGTAAAIADAVYHATGIRIRQLPIRIENLLNA